MHFSSNWFKANWFAANWWGGATAPAASQGPDEESGDPVAEYLEERRRKRIRAQNEAVLAVVLAAVTRRML